MEITLLYHVSFIVCSKPKELGMRNGLISDSQISASSQWDSNHSPSNSRLFYAPHNGRTGAWSSKTNDVNQWLQIHFKRLTAIVGVSTQGRAGLTQFVKSYTLSYSQDGSTFQSYTSNGLLKVFTGNSDTDTVVDHSLPTAIIAKYIRVHPKTWHGHISMRVEFNGCYIDCTKPGKLGLENGRIRDRQVRASSNYDSNHRAQNGRLNFIAHNGRTGAWSAKYNNVNQWLEVDLEQLVVITGICTQGRADSCCNQFVKTYIISYSMDGVVFQAYKEQNQVKVFSGNTNQLLMVHHDFSSPILARYIRIQPKTWNGHISLRMDLFGCYKDCDHDTKDLGMRSGNIQVSQITASSQWDSNHGPKNARLFFTARNGRSGAWSTRPNNLNQWLQIDFKGQTVVVGISTQGREDAGSQWVTTYMLYYSINGVSFFPYKNVGQVKVFNGNTDKHSVVHNVISPPIVARYIRLEPKSWNGHISLRVEFYGC
ncbi:Hypothetical predicted protein [Paramuricea clavata]|uniref:Uncharacterized protein n=1 Tax=Paramuricea clavata TaxID=317549 RepID=A0A6S7J8Q1_PARCT|nr:Hypothetical predicted protein [Paramuricea clavata]